MCSETVIYCQPGCNNKDRFDVYVFDVNVLLFKGSEQTSNDHLAAHPPNPSTALKLEMFNSHVCERTLRSSIDIAKRRATDLFDVMMVENANDLGDGERYFAWVRMCAKNCGYSSSFLLFTSPSPYGHKKLDVSTNSFTWSTTTNGFVEEEVTRRRRSLRLSTARDYHASSRVCCIIS
jgi:hypothetical protein